MKYTIIIYSITKHQTLAAKHQALQPGALDPDALNPKTQKFPKPLL